LNPGTFAQWAGAFIAFLALNAGTVQWLLARRDDKRFRDVSRVEELGKDFYDFKATLPLDYVRREDWIRFSSTIDAKIDGLREEIRGDLRDMKLHCPACEVKMTHA
jgi:hypothetical protein